MNTLSPTSVELALKDIVQLDDTSLDNSATTNNANLELPQSKALLYDKDGSVVIVPSYDVAIRDTAEALGEVFRNLNDLFTRSRKVCEIQKGKIAEIVPLEPAACLTRFEGGCRFKRWNTHNNRQALCPSKLAMDDCRSIILSRELHAALPPIVLVSMSPVIIEDAEGNLLLLKKSYNPEVGGVAVLDPVELDLNMTPRAGSSLLLSLLDDFDFVSPGDKARAFAAIITPALKLGGLLSSSAPIDLAEANESQAGKTYRQKITRAIYGEKAAFVCKRDGGVGSLDESIQEALFAGRPFLAIENARGRIDSQILEAAITAGSDPIPVRLPHRGTVNIDVSRVVYQMTSNSAELTPDLANRSAVVRIRKRSNSHQFQKHPEGDLLSHIEANRGKYLTSIFTLIREWHRLGKPYGQITGHHDFREWHGILQWFTTFAQLGNLLEGHAEAKARTSNSGLVWLRSVILAIVKSGKIDHKYTAAELADIGEEENLDCPGYSGNEKKQRNQAVGRLLKKAFSEGSTIPIDGHEVSREEEEEYSKKRQRNEMVKRYKITPPH